MIDFEEAYSAQEVAEMLQVSRYTVYEWAKIKAEYGGIPSYKIGGRVRIKKSDLEKWIEDKRRS